MSFRCPKTDDNPGVHQTPDFKVDANSLVSAYIDEQGDCYDSKSHDLEWDDDSQIKCLNCSHYGSVKEFTVDDEEVTDA